MTTPEQRPTDTPAAAAERLDLVVSLLTRKRDVAVAMRRRNGWLESHHEAGKPCGVCLWCEYDAEAKQFDEAIATVKRLLATLARAEGENRRLTALFEKGPPQSLVDAAWEKVEGIDQLAAAEAKLAEVEERIALAGGYHERTEREIEIEAALDQTPPDARDPADVAIGELLVMVDAGRNRVHEEIEKRVKLQAFKTWVHNYLDSHNVPHHPPGTHGAAGCRIGDRMDWLMAKLAEVTKERDEATKDRDQCMSDYVDVYNDLRDVSEERDTAEEKRRAAEAKLALAERERDGIIDHLPSALVVRVREGGGPENRWATLAASVAGMWAKLAAPAGPGEAGEETP